MTNDTKNLLMQPLYKIAEHNGLKNDAPPSFKKRNTLLEPLKEKNPEAWAVINNFLESNIKFDRIQNDKEKQTKNNAHWAAELALAEKETNSADERLKAFCASQNILI
ncbi:MAG: hypothetical protein V4635_17455 [Bacteroidota bacterium]